MQYEGFWTLKGYTAISLFLGQLGIYVFKSAEPICQFISLDFHITPGGFRCLAGGKITPSSHPKKFLKI